MYFSGAAGVPPSNCARSLSTLRTPSMSSAPSLLKPLLAQHLVELERIRRVHRVDRDGLALEVGKRIDLGLNHHPVEAVITAEHDRDIDIRLVLERERIVDRRMRDVIAAFGQPVAQFGGVRRELQIDIEAALGKESLRLHGKRSAERR